MKLKYSLPLVAAILAASTFPASAQDPDVFADSAEACPAGYTELVPSYRWEDGRFVRDGVVCESLYGGN